MYVADVAYLVRDLLFVSKIGEAADHLGVAVQGARDADRLAELARTARLVLVDLGHPAAMAALERLASDPATAAVEFVRAAMRKPASRSRRSPSTQSA